MGTEERRCVRDRQTHPPRGIVGVLRHCPGERRTLFPRTHSQPRGGKRSHTPAGNDWPSFLPSSSVLCLHCVCSFPHWVSPAHQQSRPPPQTSPPSGHPWPQNSPPPLRGCSLLAQTPVTPTPSTYCKDVGAALGLLADGGRGVGGSDGLDPQLPLADAGGGGHGGGVVAEGAAPVGSLGRGRCQGAAGRDPRSTGAPSPWPPPQSARHKLLFGRPCH